MEVDDDAAGVVVELVLDGMVLIELIAVVLIADTEGSAGMFMVVVKARVLVVLDPITTPVYTTVSISDGADAALVVVT